MKTESEARRFVSNLQGLDNEQLAHVMAFIIQILIQRRQITQ